MSSNNFNNYYEKYIKYKTKYIQLKKQISMNGGSENFGENKICIYKDINKLHPNIIKSIEDLVSIHRNNPKYLPYVFKIDKFFSELKYSNSNEYNKIINNSKISYIIDNKGNIENVGDKVIAICRGVYKPYKNSVYISMVHVSESYRGKGLCNQVMNNLIKSYNGINYFNLDVLKNNVPAIKCYSRLGFKITNEKEDEKIYYMVKSL
jgi:RimJ/RimL family protein N-acetyltransferase